MTFLVVCQKRKPSFVPSPSVTVWKWEEKFRAHFYGLSPALAFVQHYSNEFGQSSVVFNVFRSNTVKVALYGLPQLVQLKNINEACLRIAWKVILKNGVTGGPIANSRTRHLLGQNIVEIDKTVLTEYVLKTQKTTSNSQNIQSLRPYSSITFWKPEVYLSFFISLRVKIGMSNVTTGILHCDNRNMIPCGFSFEIQF